MNPLTRTNLILATLVVVLSLILWFEPGLQPSDVPTISDVQIEQVRTLELYRAGQLAVSLQRTTAHWQRRPPLPSDCQEPDCLPLQSELIGQWLHIAQLPSLHRFPAPAGRLAEFGLAEPAYELRLDDVAILIGSIDPGSQLRYVLVGQQIHLISDSYYHTLAQNP